MIVRDVETDDMAAITAIYAESVANGRGTFELEAPDEMEMTARFAAVAALGLPRLVAEIDRGVVGYAYASPFRTRQAYRYMVENSIYVAPEARGRGVASALLDALILRCEAMGLRQMVAVIGDSDNVGSVALHRARGFADAGVFKAAGWKHEGWRDVVFMQRALGQGRNTPPDAPGLPLIDKKPAA
ncbi:GNAT family N-acetyltransferase [Brevundimonas sp. SORGH_AS_0993]|uniref:GNAT family N-acetyltransferase n=1 Tax=Brevundimonas sp. SORGH_AS_0993 TaxID=3041794 RepID=UPI002789CB74|nr:GNAT family N-acetyltransferase [Brevundimonas sp. SORGH_AS_0993]MDQ1153355.1 L-amino acid N-acyltransferase YncA [Brevundimonas sp. SORGH_AS_0993]